MQNMLYEIFAQNSETGEMVTQWVEWAALAIEVLAVLIIVVSIVYNLARYTVKWFRQSEDEGLFHELRARLGRTLLLGLEVLVAGDVVRTVALDPTLMNVAALGLLVLVRTFLSWSLEVEIEGRWPWQAKPNPEQSE